MTLFRRHPGVAVLAVAAAISSAALLGSPAQAMSAGPSRTPGAATASSDTAESGSVVIANVMIKVPHGEAIPAYVVRPAGRLAPGSEAGILFLHWLGQIHNNRTEYLGEAVTLAGRGVVSVLPEGTFPWTASPVGTKADVRSVRHQVAAFHAALDRLASMPAVDQSRIALVGHDYGAMYGALLADEDTRVSVMVLETPDATWGNWFAKYWLQLQGQARADYLALFRGLDPVTHTARLGSHVLFQWAGQDIYVTKAVRQRYAASSPDAKVELYQNADHQLTDQAEADRDAFLAKELGLSG